MLDDLTADDTASLIYFGILGLVLVVTFFALWRGQMGRFIYSAAVWIAIFGALIVGYNTFKDYLPEGGFEMPRQAVVAEGDGTTIEVPVGFDGHYHLTLGINGTPVEFVVDTGATNLVLSMADAERIGLVADELKFFGRALTANGEVRTANVRLDEVTLGNLTDRNVPAVVNAGEMRGSLLGMSYLSSFGKIEIEDRTLRLTR